MRDMLKLALRAKLPLVEVSVDGLERFAEVAAHACGKTPKQLHGHPSSARRGALLWNAGPLTQVAAVRASLLEAGATLLVVRAPGAERTAGAFQAGYLPVPSTMLRASLVDAGFDAQQVDAALPALAGLSLSQALDLAKLVQADGGVLAAAGARGLRALVGQGTRGVAHLDPAPHYRDGGELSDFARWGGRYLLAEGVDPRLRPRGVLLHGPAGTGKSLAARWLAGTWGVPCLRLDVGALKGKFLGDSEQALRAGLDCVERAAPCVLLIDEVEKLFATSHDEGTTQSMLAGLLWWLAERTAPVVSVMTTNDRSKLPPEMVRAGRLDAAVEMAGLARGAADEFGAALLESLGCGGAAALLSKRVDGLFEGRERAPQADVEAAALAVAREVGLGEAEVGREPDGRGRPVAGRPAGPADAGPREGLAGSTRRSRLRVDSGAARAGSSAAEARREGADGAAGGGSPGGLRAAVGGLRSRVRGPRPG